MAAQQHAISLNRRLRSLCTDSFGLNPDKCLRHFSFPLKTNVLWSFTKTIVPV